MCKPEVELSLLKLRLCDLGKLKLKMSFAYEFGVVIGVKSVWKSSFDQNKSSWQAQFPKDPSVGLIL